MKDSAFLRKIVRENKLSLIDPNENIASSYEKKSANSIKAAKLVYDNSLLEEAVSLIYYGMYNELLSLFFKVGIKSENHTASILLLRDLFELTNDEISFAKKERIDKQYYTDFVIINEDVSDLFEKAEKFIAHVSFYKSKLHSRKVTSLRNTFSEKYM